MMAGDNKRKYFVPALVLFVASTLTLATGFTAALFIAKNTNNVELPGTIGLRSYFQRGDGSEADPFVIARPAHFYNLTRLQNLGLLSSQFHFTLGYDATPVSETHTYDPYAKNTGTNLIFYKSDSSDETQSWLDMSSHPNVLSIGSEGSPFYGIFDGNGKEIDNLSVQSGPEDVGVFGYTYSGSIVRNVYLNNISVTDNGYDTGVDGLSTLYGDVAGVTPDSGSITYVDSASSVTEFTSAPSTATTDLAGHFDVTLPSNPSIANISYLVRSSSEYFTVGTPSNGHVSITINSSTDPADTSCIAHNTTFTGTNNALLSSRFSIIARIYKEGIYYSKVLKTYQIDMKNAVTSASPYYSISMSGMLDYVNTVASGQSGYVTDASEYAHGVNIGYLIGHCDGTVKSCYVFGGTLHLNNGGTRITAKAQESETGLIGEIGPAIDNAYTPQKAYENNGDTGVVNFTKMYNDIAGTNAFTQVGSYYTYSPVSGTAAKYLSLLRQTYAPTSYYVGSASQSVDFKGRRLIADSSRLVTGDSTYDYGLGVFSLVTSSLQGDTNSTWTSGLGDYAVTKGDSFTEFYYTTAEWSNDSTLSQKPAGEKQGDHFLAPWSYDLTYQDTDQNPATQLNPNHINQGYFLPTATWVTPYSWNKVRERYFDYVFRCPLKSESDMGGNDYFYNTDSAFLQAYFNYKLVDKTGAHLTYDSGANPDFGVFVKDVNSTSGVAANIQTFNSSLKMSAPTAITEDNYDNDMIRTIATSTEDTSALTNDFGTTLGTAMATTINGMPARSINFSVKSAGGANVTVMASSPSGNGGYVGVYDKANVLTSTNNAVETYANQRPSYAMYVPYSSTVDQFAYFNYDPSTGATDSVATWAASGNKLYAHTFFLPKGDYFIGSPYQSIYIYYVCAQGQEGAGNTGRGTSVYSALNKITDVDFIARSSTDADFVLANDRCNLSFKAKFSSSAGDLSIASSKSGTTNATTVNKPSNLTSILFYNRLGYPVTFDGTTFTTEFKQWPAS